MAALRRLLSTVCVLRVHRASFAAAAAACAFTPARPPCSLRAASTAAAVGVDAALRTAARTAHAKNNVPDSIVEKLGRRLHLRSDHPLGHLKSRIHAHFCGGAAPFAVFDDLPPIVSIAQNFDSLLTPAGHVSRSPTDTFYVDDTRLLRCHMTAHQTDLIRQGQAAFLMIGDVFRRDEVDATHYPVFHQVDGVRVFQQGDLPASLRAAGAADDSDPHSTLRAEAVAFVMHDLKATLEGLVRVLFGDVEMRWVDATFPFTDPSLELEIFFEGKWLEVLGCGMIRQQILRECGRPGAIGWAFGMGLERLAMVLHGIPDIRLFWSDDVRFLQQFAGNRGVPGDAPVKFKAYSKFPGCYKDVTFWLPQGYHENDFFALVREVAGDMVESIEVLDRFTHPRSGRQSHCYRVLYRSMDRSLTNKEVDEYQLLVRQRVKDVLRGELR